MKLNKIFLFAITAIVFAGCSAMQSGSPTETLKSFIEASKKKDVETMKQLMSAGTIKMLESSAKMQNTTIDETLKKDNAVEIKDMPETRNEKITGDTATVEVKNPSTNDWDTIPFVKENGRWKLALDKFMQDLMQKMAEQMKKPEASPAPSAPPASR